MKSFRIDKRGEFISLALKKFYKSKEIIFGYALPYIYNDNSLAKKYKKILYIIKNTILTNNNFLNNFWTDVIDITNYLKNQLSTSYANNKKTVIIPEEK